MRAASLIPRPVPTQLQRRDGVVLHTETTAFVEHGGAFYWYLMDDACPDSALYRQLMVVGHEDGWDSVLDEALADCPRNADAVRVGRAVG